MYLILSSTETYGTNFRLRTFPINLKYHVIYWTSKDQLLTTIIFTMLIVDNFFLFIQWHRSSNYILRHRLIIIVLKANYQRKIRFITSMLGMLLISTLFRFHRGKQY